jgi:sulfonate transport system permease protein
MTSVSRPLDTVAAPSPAIPRRVSTRRASRLRPQLLAVIGALGFLALWEWTGRAGTFGRTWVPLTDVWDELHVPGRTRLIKRAASATFGRALMGLVVAFPLAVALASLAALVPRVRRAVTNTAVVINSVPWVALGPLLMVTVSRDRAPAVIAGLSVFFPSFVAATAGLGAATHDQEDLCGALGVSRLRRFVHVRLPNAAPGLVLGLKLAVPAALVGAIFGEWFGADRGLGLLLLTSMQQSRPPLLWTVGLICAVTAMVSAGLLGLLEVWVRRRFALSAAEVELAPERARHLGRSLAGWAVAAVVIVGLWDLYVRSSGVSSLLVPAPGEVGRDLVDHPGPYLRNAWVTARFALVGLAGGTAVGTVLAALTWWSHLARGLLTPLVVVARAVPTLALLPVVAGIFGYDDTTIVAIGILISFFPAFVYATKGLRTLPDGTGDLAAALGASRRRVFLTVALPASWREVAVAVRLSAGICVIGAVVAEFMIGRRGLGRLFSDAMGRQNITRGWATALVIVALSMAAFALANRLERAVRSRRG